MTKICSQCRSRRAKRTCPRFEKICPTCCGSIRGGGQCPADCPFLEHADNFSIERTVTRMTPESGALLRYFKDNHDRLNSVIAGILSAWAGILRRDSFYTDRIFLNAFERVRKAVGSDGVLKKSDDFRLDRAGAIETAMIDILLDKRRRGLLSDRDVVAIVEDFFFEMAYRVIDQRERPFVEELYAMPSSAAEDVIKEEETGERKHLIIT